MTTIIPGEEWRQMDVAGEHYDPASIAPQIASARERIRRYRMSDAALSVVDFSGAPVAGLEVEVVQTRSDFQWGEQLWQLSTWNRFGHGASDTVRHYTKLHCDLLNSANCLSYWTERPQNDGPKYEEFQGEPKNDEFAWQVDWCLKNGLTAKGHPLFWSLPKAVPSWLSRYSYETQLHFLEVRIRSLVARHKGAVKIWDLVNEPCWEAAFKNLAQRHWPHMETVDNLVEYIAPVMRWAREEDPDAVYVINDYGLEIDPPGRDLRAKDGSVVNAKRQRQRFVELFTRLRDAGSPADALGMQAHTGGWIDPTTQLAILDHLADAGLPLHYTEFWASTEHLEKAKLDPAAIAQLKAEYITNICTIAFSHPRVESFFFWGGASNEFGFRNDHNSGGVPTSGNAPTLVYQRLKQLLRSEWMTRETLTTDHDGRIRLRGFHGDYSLRYRNRAGMPCGTTFRITKDSANTHTLRVHRPG